MPNDMFTLLVSQRSLLKQRDQVIERIARHRAYDDCGTLTGDACQACVELQAQLTEADLKLQDIKHKLWL